MIEIQNESSPESLRWSKQNIRSLRMRLGWSRSELAYRLHCSPDEVAAWEEGGKKIDKSRISDLELILRQADACSDEVLYTPAAESQCDKRALEQIDFSRVKADLE